MTATKKTAPKKTVTKKATTKARKAPKKAVAKKVESALTRSESGEGLTDAEEKKRREDFLKWAQRVKEIDAATKRVADLKKEQTKHCRVMSERWGNGPYIINGVPHIISSKSGHYFIRPHGRKPPPEIDL